MRKSGNVTKKKMVSCILAIAMIFSVMCTSVFAGQNVSATAKVVGAVTISHTTGSLIGADAPELQLKIDSTSYTSTATGEMEVEIELDDATWIDGYDVSDIVWYADDTIIKGSNSYDSTAEYQLVVDFVDDEEILVTAYGQFKEDDVIAIPLCVDYDLSSSDYATVSIDSDAVEDDLVFLFLAPVTATAKVVGAVSKTAAGAMTGSDVPRLEITITEAATANEEIEIKLDDAIFLSEDNVSIISSYKTPATIKNLIVNDNKMTFTVDGYLEEGDVIAIDLETGYDLYATISVSSDVVTEEDLIFVYGPLTTSTEDVSVSEAKIEDDVLYFTIEIEGDADIPEGTQVIFALYDDAGKLVYIGAATEVKEGQTVISIDGTTEYTVGKIFVMDESFISLLPSTQIDIQS